ncbi:flavodoxin family protein [Pseudodesulfovibrio sp. zrk46]|uniref:flavodoxin family protein n=1 Tax=Pseudodesulfovibrio sp. zrk46 TaxID=2725288 RepID=UPI001449CE8D|nr:flavodoxin family protein [Pseudodesulfovibrio sp. zrk46]QJB56427.1 flavodoxin family protein [Pseudodesulfovibrio sp. zrk46]
MIIGFEGSPRRGGNSHKILEAILFGAEGAGESAEAVHLRDYDYKPCLGCEKCRKDKICTRMNDGMTLLYPRIIDAKGLVLVTPVHNYNVTAWVKAFIDRLYCFYDFNDERPRGWSSRLAGQGRKAVIVAIAEQEKKYDMGVALEAMRLPMTALGFDVVEEVAILRMFDRGIVVNHDDIMDQARNAGQTLAKALGK